MKFFWPSPEILTDLVVSQIGETSFEFSAPEGTECAKWLSLFDKTPELQEEFRSNVIKMILASIDARKQ
jgi:hypothetical protein